MPDFKNFSITRNGNVTVQVPRFNIKCDIVDSRDGSLIRSFDINFPSILQNLDNEDIRELFEEFITKIILHKYNKKIN